MKLKLQGTYKKNSQVACTSQLQSWNKKGGGENIVAQPVMEVVVKKAKLDEPSTSRCGGGVKCLLYEARRQPQHDLEKRRLLNLNFQELIKTWVLLI